MGDRAHLVLLGVAALLPSCGVGQQIRLDKIVLPEGFRIEVYSADVPEAREMVFSPNGILFVGSWSGKVFAIIDQDGDHKADRVAVVARGLDQPVGVDFHEGDLYISAVDRVVKLPSIENRIDDPPAPVVVNESFPDDQHHGWKFIRFGPDNRLYVPIGAPCNVCLREDPRYSTIMRMKPDGSELEIFAEGIRNTVGFDWHPTTGELWFTENGRDWMGDNRPPDELNRAAEPGLHFGFPYLHGYTVWDPVYGPIGKAKEIRFVRPEIALGPHVAALGMRFYTGTMFPEKYRNHIFIAEHGSWNRARPIGYRVQMVRLENSTAISYETFAEGWMQDGKAWGRPADVEVAPDGALMVSDDKAGAIYRVSYAGNDAAESQPADGQGSTISRLSSSGNQTGLR